MGLEIDWKELLGKAAMGGFYGAITELSLTQSADREMLLFCLAGAGIRGLIVFLQIIKDSLVPKSTAGPRKKSLWRRCL